MCLLMLCLGLYDYSLLIFYLPSSLNYFKSIYAVNHVSFLYHLCNVFLVCEHTIANAYGERGDLANWDIRCEPVVLTST